MSPDPLLLSTPPALAPAIADLRRAGRFALDTESNSLYAYHYRVCLIQISTDATDYLIDALALPNQQNLVDLAADPGIEITMHAAENDVLMLHRDFGFRCLRLFDTLWASRILGWKQVGLAALLRDRFGVELDKRMQRTDWGRRPLSPDQLVYARLDTHYLLPLRDQLEAELRAHGRWDEAKEVFAEITTITWEEKDTPSFWRLPGAGDMEPRQQAVLKALFDWREATAAQRDIPPFKVLGNETLIALAQAQPDTLTALHGVRGVPRHLPERTARALLRTLREGRVAAVPPPPERSHGSRPDNGALARFDRLRGWRTSQAERRGVDADVILTNQILMAIAKANPRDLPALQSTGLLGPWKLDAYGSEILQTMHNRSESRESAL